jgi:hypothetical protein
MQPVEITARIKRDELHALLETMTPAEQQPITKRTFIADIEEEIARQLAVTASSTLSVEIRSTPTRERGHTVTLTTLATLKEPVAIRLERAPWFAPKYLAAVVAIIGLVAVLFLR